MSRRPRLTTLHALALVVVGLAAALITRSTALPTSWHFTYNLAMAAVVTGIAVAAGLDADNLGCSPARVGDGLRLGALAFASIAAVVGVGAALGWIDGLDGLDEPGSTVRMALKTLVIIPVGTVAVEEMIFRGALHGLLSDVTDPARAWIAGAILFGLWHLPPIADDGVSRVIFTVLATTAAGAAFVWLRRRSGSIVAPMLAHTATNSVTYAFAWMLT